MPIEKVEISVSTQSQVMKWGSLPQPVTPKITMNGNPVQAPKQAPLSPVGWHLLIVDSTKDMKNPASYLFNGYLALSTRQGNWSSIYHEMYDFMFRDVFVSGNVNAQLVILSSFGLDNNMPPTNDILPVLLELGAGPRLQYWETHCTPGSEVGSTNAYVSFPTNYVLIGYSSWTYGQGYEQYDTATNAPVQTTLTATVSQVIP